MKLYYTPRSHFSRKVRILVAAWDLGVELVDVGNVADTSDIAFGHNPLMKVPALVDEGRLVIDSDHIAQHLVRAHDPDDRFAVLSEDTATLNARAVLNGIMAAEVELILAERTGIAIGRYARFDKMRASILAGLDWPRREHSLLLVVRSRPDEMLDDGRRQASPTNET